MVRRNLLGCGEAWESDTGEVFGIGQEIETKRSNDVMTGKSGRAWSVRFFVFRTIESRNGEAQISYAWERRTQHAAPLREAAKNLQRAMRLFLGGAGQGQEDSVIDGDGAGEKSGGGGAGYGDGLCVAGDGWAGGFALQGISVAGNE